MRSAGARLRIALLAFALFGLSFALYAATCAPGLTWRHDGADGGDFARAVALGSIPHPTGYPSYLLLARVAVLGAESDPAGRLNLFSAFCTAAAVALFGVRQSRATGRASAVIAALALATTPLVWSQALITEVHGLQLLAVAASLAAFDTCMHQPSARRAMVAGLVFGLGLGNHVTLVFLAPYAVFALHRAARSAWLAAAFGLALGLCVYAALPLAAASPWGRIDSPAALLAYVTADLYRGYLFGGTPSAALARLLASPALAVSDFAPWGAAAAVYGAVVAWRVRRAESAALALCALASMAFSIAYNTTDAYHYLLVAWVVLAVWLARGVARLLAWARARGGARGRVAALAASGVLCAALVVARWPALDLSHDRATDAETGRVLAVLPRNAVLATAADRQTFALWYHIEVRGERPDVQVVDRDLLNYAPYRIWLAGSQAAAAAPDAVLRALAADGARPLWVLEPSGDVRLWDARDAR